MKPTSASRSVAVVALSTALLALCTTAVRGYETAFDAVCGQWESSLESPDFLWCQGGTWNDWSWNGEYDISSYGEEAPTYAAYLCDDVTFSCWDTCESSEYRARALTRVNWESYPCTYDDSCIATWGSPSCQMGSTGTFSCSCTYFNTCTPCQ